MVTGRNEDDGERGITEPGKSMHWLIDREQWKKKYEKKKRTLENITEGGN